MTTSTRQQTGTAVWVDLSTSDLGRAEHFYEGLFGWHYEEHEVDSGAYLVAGRRDGVVAGLMEEPAGPPTWTVYFAVDHLESTLTRVRDLGGTVVQRPVGLPEGGHVALIADPSGAVCAVIEGPASGSTMTWGAPGAVTWVECLSRDLEPARRFFEQLFGWADQGESRDYIVLHHDSREVAGLMAMPPSVPADAPSHWLVYFATTDADATCARAAALGGQVLTPPMAVQGMRFAVLADPAGAVFGILEQPAR